MEKNSDIKTLENLCDQLESISVNIRTLLRRVGCERIDEEHLLTTFFDQDISSLEMTVRSINVLKNQDINSIKDILLLEGEYDFNSSFESALISLPNLGAKSREEILVSVLRNLSEKVKALYKNGRENG